MPAPRKVTSSSAERLRAASALSSSSTSCSERPGGRSISRPSRTPAGISSNRSSIESTPMASSISRRSRSVAEVYLVMADLRLQQVLVGAHVEQGIGLARLAQSHLDHPALPVGVGVDLLWLVRQRLVDLDDLPGQR